MSHLPISRVTGGVLAAVLVLPVIAVAAGDYDVSPTSISHTLGEGETASDTVTITVPEDAVVPKLDVYLLADTTGSMGSVLTGVKSGATTIVNDLYGNSLGIDVEIGVGRYRDFQSPQQDSFVFDHQLAPASSTNKTSVTSAINAWSAGGGYDIAEGQFFALDQLAKDSDPAGGSIGWRSDAKKLIVWFGDAPGHDSICKAISSLSYDITESSVTSALQAEEIVVVAIGTTSGVTNDLNANPVIYSSNYNSECGTPGGSAGQASRIASATGGSYTSGVSGSTIASNIITLVEDEAGKINSLTLVASGDAADYITDITPDEVVDIDTSEESDHDFTVDWEGDCFDTGEETLYGTLTAKADGADVACVSVSVTIPACCAADDGHLGSATGYNAFILGNFEGTNSDIGGKVAIGGDAKFTGYGIASALGSGSGDVLHVGGNLTITNSQIYGGDGEVAGTCTSSSVGTPSGSLNCSSPNAYDASNATSEMQAIADDLADLTTNGTTTTYNWGGVTLSGTDPDRNVFELDLDNLGFSSWVWNGYINTFNISAPSGSTVVINVVGNTAPLFKNGGINLTGVTRNDVVWNFDAATALEVKNVSVPGSIMAPDAAVTFNNGNIKGTLVAGSMKGSGELHSFSFSGDSCPAPL